MYGMQLNRSSEITLSRQIYKQLSEAIHHSRISAGEKLPASRELAKALGVSRNTVNEAYEMLKIEGYVESLRGSAFYVADNLDLRPIMNHSTSAEKKIYEPVGYGYDYRTGLPDMEEFPFFMWKKHQQKVMSVLRDADFLYGSPQGHIELRREIAAWLFRSRGISAEPDCIFITAGASHAISMVADVLNDYKSTFIIEDPSHVGILKILEMKNAKYEGIPVDADGMQINKIKMRNNIKGYSNINGQGKIAGIYVTPSHQFPTGCILPAKRRVELIRLARDKNTYIIEDDYDSEFRYDGSTITPLYLLDPDRVIYIGTFSKTLFPALRIGFALLPGELHNKWRKLRRYSDIQNPIIEQLTLADFLRERTMDKHVRKMKRIYAHKRDLLIQSIKEQFENVNIMGDSSGLHICVQIDNYIFDDEIQQKCIDAGLYITLCKKYSLNKEDYKDVLLLGYGNINADNIHEGILLLKHIIN